MHFTWLGHSRVALAIAGLAGVGLAAMPARADCLAECPPVNNQTCATTIFGAVAGEFNAFYLFNFFATAGEVKGRLGACGDVAIGEGFTVGKGIVNATLETLASAGAPALSYAYTLLSVDGKVLGGDNSSVFNGNVYLGNASGSVLPAELLAGLQAYGFATASGTNGAPVPNCTLLGQTWKVLANDLVSLDATVQWSSANALLYAFLPAIHQVEVVHLSAADVAGASALAWAVGQDAPSTAPSATPQAFVINVAGSNIEIGPADHDILAPYASRILWNFYEAETLAITQTVFYGSILAPYATILSTSSGEIHGQVFAAAYANSSALGTAGYIDLSGGMSYFASYMGQMTVYNTPFNACLPLALEYPDGAPWATSAPTTISVAPPSTGATRATTTTARPTATAAEVKASSTRLAPSAALALALFALVASLVL